nr:MAG TPA: hypothetical protein [Caudoviricetes sp.]
MGLGKAFELLEPPKALLTKAEVESQTTRRKCY